MHLDVSSEVDFSLESPRTEIAGERLKPAVLPAVRDEVGRLTEGLSTLPALVRFLTCSREMERWMIGWTEGGFETL